MVTFNKEEWRTVNGELKCYATGSCLSTDTKPTENLINGSILMEMDTGKVYMLDEPAGEWREF